MIDVKRIDNNPTVEPIICKIGKAAERIGRHKESMFSDPGVIDFVTRYTLSELTADQVSIPVSMIVDGYNLIHTFSLLDREELECQLKDMFKEDGLELDEHDGYPVEDFFAWTIIARHAYYNK